MIEHQYENRCDNTMLLQSPQKRCTDAPPQRATCDTVSHLFLRYKLYPFRYNSDATAQFYTCSGII